MTTVAIPAWFPYLILYALCTGLLLGLEHEIFWPGKNVTNPLPVWATQIMGTATLWIGATAFFVIELHTWAPPLIDVDLRSETDRGQLSLWDAECSGICGV